MESNPIVALRKRAGVKRSEFALALGVPYQALWQAESGYVENPRSVIAALGRMGYDAAQVAADYARWYAVRSAAAREKLGVPA